MKSCFKELINEDERRRVEVRVMHDANANGLSTQGKFLRWDKDKCKGLRSLSISSRLFFLLAFVPPFTEKYTTKKRRVFLLRQNYNGLHHACTTFRSALSLKALKRRKEASITDASRRRENNTGQHETTLRLPLQFTGRKSRPEKHLSNQMPTELLTCAYIPSSTTVMRGTSQR